MKFSKIAIPKLATYAIMIPLPIALLCIFMTCAIHFGTHSSNWFFLISVVADCVLLVSGYIYYFRIAFCPYKITSQGISNRHITIDWEKVTTYKVHSVEVSAIIRPFRMELTQVCVIPCTDASSYRELNPRECVFFQVTKENLLLIDRYCTHKSEEIKDLLLRYSDMLGRSVE